jgi:sugar lactone lactonase YvrE
MPQDDAWVTITGATTIWGLALDVANHRLYVGSPVTSRVYTIDLTAPTPSATMLAFTAGQPNGLTMGPDGAMYYSDFGAGNVWRVDSSGARTRVTTTVIPQANGVAFGADGALYVDSYANGTVVKLTLASGMETARTVFAMNLGSPDGIAFDATGRLYVTDNAGGRLIRLNADGTAPMVLRAGLNAPANVEFGVGDLSCTDIYVATRGALLQYEMGTTPGADVPWHH